MNGVVVVTGAARGIGREAVARWARSFLEDGGVTGELVRLGAGHIGKALP